MPAARSRLLEFVANVPYVAERVVNGLAPAVEGNVPQCCRLESLLQIQFGSYALQPKMSPVPGSTLPGSSVTFSWTMSATASEYDLYVGTRAGANDVFSQNVGSLTSYTVGGLPSNGGMIYVRLWSHLPDAWYYFDYTYTAASLIGGGGGTTTYGEITSPKPGSTLTGSTVTFSWTPSANASEYVLYVGTTVGGYDIFDQNVGSYTSFEIFGLLPTDGATIYVRLWSHLPNAWYYLDYTYTAALLLGAGGQTANVQVTFNPASVVRNSTDGKFHYSVGLQEVNGVGVTLTGMWAGGTDLTSDIASWFGSTSLAPNGQASALIVSTCSVPCNYDYPWTFTGNDKNGHIGLTWSGAVFLGQ